MSSNTQKRGFRLPWGADRGAEDGVAAASFEPGAPAETTERVREDLGGGPPPNEEPETPVLSRDADPAASNVPTPTAEADMFEADTVTAEPVEGHSADATQNPWPEDDRAAAPAPAPETPAVRAPRRDNPLVAGLVKAMREATLASRQDTTTRLTSEAAARIEAIRAGSSDEAVALRKRADEDIAEIREWSKAEIARIRQQTDDRIEARKDELAAETERHAASVERQVEVVQSTVDRYESDMDRFFERLLAENDPARLATLAEQAPEPPDLSGDLQFDWVEPDDIAAGDGSDDVVAGDVLAARLAGLAPVEGDAALGATAAAEAEATEGLDMSAADEWPAAVLSAARRGEAAQDEQLEQVADGAGVSRLLVSGLTTVAAISAFKGAVGSLPGVHSVSVSSGDPGVFVFTVNHHPETDLGAAVNGMPGFAIRISEATGEALTLTANEAA